MGAMTAAHADVDAAAFKVSSGDKWHSCDVLTIWTRNWELLTVTDGVRHELQP
jgi:hypothetical protein